MTDVEGEGQAGSAGAPWVPPTSVWTPPDAALAGQRAAEPPAETSLGGPARPVGAEPPSPVPLRPATPAAVYDGAFEILKTRPRVLLGAAAVIVVPVQLLALWARGGPHGADLLSWFVALDGSSDLAVTLDQREGVVWASGALEVVVTFLVGAVVARTVATWYAGGDPGIRQALGAALGRPVALLGAFVGMAAAQALGVAAFCGGLLLPLAWFAPLAPALVVEQLGAGAALRRSFQLANRRMLAVVGVVVGMAFIDQVLRLSLETVPWLLADGLPGPVTLVVRAVIVVGVSVLSSVFIGAASTLLYFDLRVRTEGLDLELEATDAFALPR